MKSPRPPWSLVAATGGILLLVLGCAGAEQDEQGVLPPLVPADVPAIIPVAAHTDTGLDDADPEPDTDDGVAAADPDRVAPPASRPAPAPKSPHEPAGSTDAPRPEGVGDAPADDEEGGGKAKRPVSPAPPGISQVDGSTWHVKQTLVDRWQADPHVLGNVRENGVGWELMGIRQRNAYHLGMRNGDIVVEVNGRKLNTMPQLLAAYLALKNQKSFDVVFLRKGVRTTHHYRIAN